MGSMMKQSGTRAALFQTTVLFGVVALLGAATTAQAQTRDYRIPDEPLSRSLTDFGRASGLQIVFTEGLVAGKSSPALIGTFTAPEALKRILANSDLEARTTPSGTVMIVRRGGEEAGPQRADPPGQADSPPPVSEVVVTAQKRSERLLQVPVPVTALSGAELVREHAVRLQDYAAAAPGLNLLSDRDGSTEIIMRGVTTGLEVGATTSVYIDDSPYGSSTSYALGALLTPDLDPGALAQVEVLRGPQGTLYGASSLGGLIKYVTVPPSLTTFGGRIQADYSAVDGGGSGYGLRAMVTAPLIADTLGVTVSAFDRQDPGYIDNAVTGAKNVNVTRVDGGRMALLFKPTDRLMINLSGLFQDSYSDGTNDVDLNSNFSLTHGLKQTRYIAEPLNIRARLYSADVADDLGVATLRSITSYQTEQVYQGTDETQTYGPLVGAALGLTDLGVDFSEPINQNKITEEVRLSSPNNNRFEWQGGFFFTHEDSRHMETLSPFDTLTGQPINLGVPLLTAGLLSHYTEYAGFGDLTYHFTPQFDLQVGGRYAYNDQQYQQPGNGILVGGPSEIIAGSHDTSGLFLVTPRYKFNDQQMIYARIASGYRPGGPNAVDAAEVAQGVSPVFKPDTLVNYEVGYKGAFPSQRATLQLSAFDIEWKNIQILETLDGLNFLGNGANARSAGLEAAATWAPVRGLSLSANAAYTDAYLTANAPGVNARSGAELPEVPRFSANLSAQYDFSITGQLDGYVGGSVRYLGDRRGEFAAGSPAGYVRPTLDAYTTEDLRAGIIHGGVELAVFVRNLSDSHGLNRISSLNFAGYGAPWTGSVIQPRTFGVSISDKF
jgi:iron complex outermembrane receptor protein